MFYSRTNPGISLGKSGNDGTENGISNMADKITKCANCGKSILLTDYARLSNAILKLKPICSYECNKALGQVK